MILTLLHHLLNQRILKHNYTPPHAKVDSSSKSKSRDVIKPKKEDMVIIRRNPFEGLELDDDSYTVTNNNNSHNSNSNSTTKQTTSSNKSHVKAHSTIDTTDNDDDFIKIERKTSKSDLYKPKKNRK